MVKPHHHKVSMPSTNCLAAAAALGALFATVLLLEQRFRGPSAALVGQGAGLCSNSPKALQAGAQPDPGSLVTSVQPPAGLEDVLRRVAPSREVLMALSDSNMLKEVDGTPGLFYMWLQVSVEAGVLVQGAGGQHCCAPAPRGCVLLGGRAEW